MKRLLGRQPIFNREMQLVAYELLYRTDKDEKLDAKSKTLQVINHYIGNDLSKVVADKKAFINFSAETIVNNTTLVLNKEQLVIEVLEDVVPTEEVIIALKRLKKLGYAIALDDVTAELPAQSLLELADIIKIDFTLTTESERQQILEQLKVYDVLLLAEKVENMKEFAQARRNQFDLFQGYFFARPDLLLLGQHKPLAIKHLNFLVAAINANTDFEYLLEMIEMHEDFKQQLVKLLNLVFYYRQNQLQSFRCACMILGYAEMRRWIVFLVLRRASKGKPLELYKIALIRAKMIEMLRTEVNAPCPYHDSFLIGIFSLMDVMLEHDMRDLMQQFPLPDEVKRALINSEGNCGKILGIIRAYENSDLNKVAALTKSMQINQEKLPYIYVAALEWVETLKLEQL